MSAPWIKIYALPPTYTQASDDDVQPRIDDELLPVVVKQDPLGNVMPLTGVKQGIGLLCHPVIFPLNTSTITLTRSAPLTYTAGGSAVNIAIPASGFYSPQVSDGSSIVLSPTGYQLIANAGDPTLFDHLLFYNQPTEPISIQFYTKSTGSTSYFALPNDQPYTGPNTAISKVIVTPNGTGNVAYEGIQRLATLAGTNNGLVHLPTAATSLSVSYWWHSAVSQWFAGDHCNWIANHMLMWPDVFVGTEDYPGDDGTINGIPVVQGVVPEFAAIGTYSIDYRDGVVRFPQSVDSTKQYVGANYSYLIGICNVTSQQLDPVSQRALSLWASPNGAGQSFYFDMNLSATHQVSFYCYDDGSSRGQTVSVLDAVSNSVLATHSLTTGSFSNGIYVTFNLLGHVHVKFTQTAGTNAVCSGFFYDSAGASGVSYIGTDSVTQGNWYMRYGKDGRKLDNSGNVLNSIPGYATFAGASGSSYTSGWDSETAIALLQTQMYAFAAQSELIHPASHGRPWVSRTDQWLPRNLYSNQQIAGQPITVSPYDILTVKLS